VQDGTGQIQLFVTRDALDDAYAAAQALDLGDTVGAEGLLFKIKTGELRCACVRCGC
jgi:lysyl-tRNA synthetase class 2